MYASFYNTYLIGELQMSKWSKDDLMDHHSVAGLLFNDKMELLVMDHVKLGMVLPPIGKVDHGESLEHGLSRELYEEVGITVKGYREMGIREKVVHRDGHRAEIALHFYLITTYKGDIVNKEPGKHKNLRWESASTPVDSNPRSFVTEWLLENGFIEITGNGTFFKNL